MHLNVHTFIHENCDTSYQEFPLKITFWAESFGIRDITLGDLMIQHLIIHPKRTLVVV